MSELHQVLVIAAGGFRGWRGNRRIALTFILGFILCFLLTERSVQFAETYGTLLQVAEPFVWVFGDAQNILLVSLLLVLLFADMPFLNPGTPFYLARTTRMVWLLGQILYVCAATLLYMLFILAATCALCAHLAFTGNLWSETAAMLAYSGAGQQIALPAAVKTLEMSTPYECMMQIFVLMLLYTLLMVSLMLAFNIWKGAAAGIVSVFAFSLFGLLLTPNIFITLFDLPPELFYQANVLAGWISPLNQATYQRHNFGYDLLPRLQDTWVIFAAVILILFAWALSRIRRYNFRFTGTAGGGRR